MEVNYGIDCNNYHYYYNNVTIVRNRYNITYYTPNYLWDNRIVSFKI